MEREVKIPCQVPGQGYSLTGTLINPVVTEQKVPAVVFYHGMVSKRKPRYVKRARELARRGIAILTFDFRGCGESDGKLGELSLADWFSDALLAFDYLADQSFVNKERIGISGKSFGGYMAALVCAERNVKSIVVQAPGLYDDAWFEQKFSWDESFMQQRKDYRNGPNVLNNKAIAAIQQFNNPLLVIGSELDDVCPKHTLEGYFNASTSDQKKLAWIKSADHALTDEKWNKEYTELMADWLAKTLKNP